MNTNNWNIGIKKEKEGLGVDSGVKEAVNFGTGKTFEVKNSQCELFFENKQENRIKDPVRDFGDMRLLKIREVAAILGCSVKETYTLSYECGLPTRKLRGRVRVLGSDLKKWLEDLPKKRRSAA